MIDYQNLLQILHINGLNEKSTLEEIDVVFKALGYSPENRNEAIQSLKTNGWLSILEQTVVTNNVQQTPIEAPVKASINPTASVNVVPPAPVSQVLNSPPKKSMEIIMISIIILILLAGAGVAFAYVQKIGPFKPITIESLPVVDNVQETASTTDISTSTNQIVVSDQNNIATSSVDSSNENLTVDKDIESVKESFNKIKEANDNKNEKLMDSYLSKKTLDMNSSLSAGGGQVSQIWYKDLKFVSAKKEGSIMLVTITSINDNGRPETDEFVFVKENNIWKMGIFETLQRSLSPAALDNNSQTASSGAGKSDLIVTSIQIYPNNPKANDPNIEIDVSIKNIGTKEVPSGVETMAYLDGSNNTQGNVFESIAPGKSVTWTINPYSNPFIKYNDLPGKHELKIVLDPNKKLIGENLSNNTFTETINLY